MPRYKRPTKSRYNNPFERIDHQIEDVHADLRGVKKDVSDIKLTLGQHRKEEKDNGKRIDALTKRADALPEEIAKAVAKELKKLLAKK